MTVHGNSDIFGELCLFAGALGWSTLRICRKTLPPDAKHRKPGVVTWYEAGAAAGDRSNVFLQINESPLGTLQTFSAAVYAIRFRICTGWHDFRLTSKLKFDALEAERLDSWLHRRWFKSVAMRREFRANHPECAGYSWSRIRELGPPRRHSAR